MKKNKAEEPIDRVRRLLNDRIRRHEFNLVMRFRSGMRYMDDGEKEERGFIDGLYSALGLVVSAYNEDEALEMEFARGLGVVDLHEEAARRG